MAASLPSTMRACQWAGNKGGIEKSLKVNNEAPLPKTAKALPPDQTLVKVSYSTLNPVDFKIFDMPFVGGFLKTPGLDFAGTVVESKLDHIKPGEPVFGATPLPAFGALGEYTVVGKEGLCPMPNGVDPKQAACVGIVGLTAYQCIVPYLKAGDKVFINGGSGGTGTFGVQIAKAIGVHVTTSCSGPNVDLCKSLGADQVIDYRTQNVVDTLKRSGHQYDLIVDNVFKDSALYWQSHHYLKPSGRFVTIAGEPSLSMISTVMSVFLWPSFLGGGQRKFGFVTCKSNAEQYAHLAQMMKDGKLKAVIEREYGLEEVGEAFSRLKSGRTRGKLIVKVGS